MAAAEASHAANDTAITCGNGRGIITKSNFEAGVFARYAPGSKVPLEAGWTGALMLPKGGGTNGISKSTLYSRYSSKVRMAHINAPKIAKTHAAGERNTERAMEL